MKKFIKGGTLQPATNEKDDAEVKNFSIGVEYLMTNTVYHSLNAGSIKGMDLQGGYEVQTSFMEDFSQDEHLSYFLKKDSSQDSWAGFLTKCLKDAFESWKNDYKFLTEYVIVMSHRSWYWQFCINELKDEEKEFFTPIMEEMRDAYCDMYEVASTYALENLKDEALNYYLHWTD